MNKQRHLVGEDNGDIILKSRAGNTFALACFAALFLFATAVFLLKSAVRGVWGSYVLPLISLICGLWSLYFAVPWRIRICKRERRYRCNYGIWPLVKSTVGPIENLYAVRMNRVPLSGHESVYYLSLVFKNSRKLYIFSRHNNSNVSEDEGRRVAGLLGIPFVNELQWLGNRWAPISKE